MTEVSRVYVDLTFILTSSLVVWLELIRYVWKPDRPTIDQTEKKHTTTSNTVEQWSQGKLSFRAMGGGLAAGILTYSPGTGDRTFQHVSSTYD